MDERYDPWQHARDLGVTVAHEPQPDGRWGWYDVTTSTAVLDVDLCQYERRCTLAHEIQHHLRGDGCGLSDREEEVVHEAAARELIPINDLSRSVAVWGENWHRVAEDLWVDDETLRIRLLHLHVSEHHALRRAMARREDVA